MYFYFMLSAKPFGICCSSDTDVSFFSKDRQKKSEKSKQFKFDEYLESY